MCDSAVLSITKDPSINTTIKSFHLESTWNFVLGIAGTNHFFLMIDIPSCSLEILQLNHSGFDANAWSIMYAYLRELNLGNNWHIADAGWETFAGVLRNPNPLLKIPDSAHNEINDEAMMSFADSLTNNNKLVDLILDHDPDDRHIKPVGCAAFIRMLCDQSRFFSVPTHSYT